MIKKLISNLIIVFIVVFILDLTIGKTLRHFYFRQTSGYQFRTTYAMEKTEAEILIFGSSRANHNYIPEVFEDSLKMTFYNTGRDGNGIAFQTAVLRSVLKRYTPKVIIIDYYGDFQKNASSFDNMSSLYPYYRTHKEVRGSILLNNSFERVKLVSEIYPFNSQVLSITIGNLEINKKRYLDNKGYVPLYKEWQDEIDTVEYIHEYEIDSVKSHSFKELINTAKMSNAKVVVVYSPIYRVNANRQEIQICKEICSRENVAFWDFSNDTLFLNDRKLFQDVQHLNHRGAQIFSSLIADRLKYKIFGLGYPSF